ncbi:recombination protein NinB [Epibacterium ulvae]|uniref:recombination protein NinB n=1 Tax=Epibacterium ulvae TaxID=1156985 RepID=UPI00249096FE|nr:recombination protein NinB [Epibacterium ulvae]
MAGQTVILTGSSQRRFAHSLIEQAPVGAVLNVKKAKRTVDQNAKMWAMLSDISRAAPEGRRWTTDVWKSAFMHALGHEIMWQQGLNGEPFPTGFRTSKLDKDQMADLITMIQEYGDRHDVRWTTPEASA